MWRTDEQQQLITSLKAELSSKVPRPQKELFSSCPGLHVQLRLPATLKDAAAFKKLVHRLAGNTSSEPMITEHVPTFRHTWW